MYRRLLSLSFFACSVLSSVFAVHIPVRRESVSIRDGSHSFAVTKTSKSAGNLTGFLNVGDYRYIGNITIAGESFEVILDTGSPDLWIVTDSALSGSTNTSVAAQLNYGTDSTDSSSIMGSIFLADVDFGGFSISNQAYSKPTRVDVPNNTVSSGLLAPGMGGLIGLSPSEGSTIAANLQQANYNASGYNPLQNIFHSNPSMPAQFTILMSRNEGEGDTSGGVFTISDVVEEYASIQDTPVLLVGSKNPVLAQHWSVHMEAIIINGQWYNTSSSGAANLTAILDTGTPTAYIDPRFVDIMYGANAEKEGDFSIVPCSAQINVSLVFGGTVFPIDPIDATEPAGIADNGSVICEGAFARLEGFPDGTLLLGDTFLRNAYTLYNLNVGTANAVHDGPYVQMLNITNAATAASNFAQLNNQRLKNFAEAYGGSYVGSDDDSDVAAGSLSSQGTSSSSGNDYSALMRNSYIMIGLMSTAILLLLAIAILLVRRARESPKRAYRPVGAEKFDNVPLQYESYNATYKD
ncbi:hypothetical protein FOMPIDRAFT_1126854 [Fomitopsis schrenkii]|uniref:Peptidase A1 domain-containing protein n=1 Tax=Fomitopsis schrenkii TaxID=2126942 RepID=S8E4K3_FOMSC|nr:hypothetical protein FOMPIDRAFT_1126854 [Fomitopsis schrenkii]